jgi:hypothetical protein
MTESQIGAIGYLSVAIVTFVTLVIIEYVKYFKQLTKMVEQQDTYPTLEIEYPILIFVAFAWIAIVPIMLLIYIKQAIINTIVNLEKKLVTKWINKNKSLILTHKSEQIRTNLIKATSLQQINYAIKRASYLERDKDEY